MIDVIDNALPESIFNKLSKEAIDKDFPWYMGNDIDPDTIDKKLNTGITLDKNTIPSFQFFHVFYSMADDETREKGINSNFFNLYNKPIFTFLENYKLGKKLQLFKSKLNLLTNIHNFKSNDLYNIPHLDVTTDHISVLLYLNDSDGDTTFFNERFIDEKRPNSLTIKQKVSPKKNRMVISNGYFHASANPIQSNYRVVYNGVFIDT